MTETDRQKKNDRIAWATSIGLHAALFLIFMFAIAWRAPNPPLPEYGIELNFGLDAQGSGAIQPETPVGNNQDTEQQEDVTAEQQEVQPEQTQSEAATETVTPSKQESPVVVKEEKKEQQKTPEKVQEKIEEKPQPRKEEVKAVYKPDKSESKTGQPGNHGDDPDKTGDKGDPKGTLDAKSLYGKSGGGAGGSSLDLAGWQWDEIPKPDVPNNESGRVVFEIKVDSNGEIVSIKTLERSVSLEAENACRKEIEKLTFTKTGNNVPPISTGKITFLVRSN